MNDLKDIKNEAIRQAIIDSGRKIIVEKGLDGLSMRKLAKTLGCSPATLYKHFANKEAILEAIREEGWRIMAELAVENPSMTTDPKDALLELSGAFQRFPAQYPDHYLLMFGSLLSQTMTVKSHLQDKGFQGLVAVMESFMQSGVIKREPYYARELAYLVWFLSHGIAMLRITLFRDDPEFIKISEDVLSAFAESVLL